MYIVWAIAAGGSQVITEKDIEIHDIISRRNKVHI